MAIVYSGWLTNEYHWITHVSIIPQDCGKNEVIDGNT